MSRTTLRGLQVTDSSITAIDTDDSIEKTANKGIASGYAPLDVSLKVPTLNLGGVGANISNFLCGNQTWSILPQIITSGSYMGDTIKNRAIEHSLNVIPRCVIISNTDGKLYTIIAPGIVSYNNGGYPALIWTSTFFYVAGGTLIPGANQNGRQYYWVAFG